MTVPGPLHSLTDGDLGVLLAAALGAVAAVGMLFPQLRTGAAPKGVLSLEMPWSESRARQVVDSFEAHGLTGADRRGVFIDFVWVPLYVAALVCAALLAARAGAASGLLSTAHDDEIANHLVVASIAAGVLDYLENGGMLLMLGGHVSGPLAVATSVVSAVKWVLCAAVVVTSLGLLLASLIAAVCFL